MHLSKLSLLSKSCIAIMASLMMTETSHAEQSELSVLSYNVAGLPGFISGSDPERNSALISPLLNNFDLVAVQEDFNYHNQLVSSVTHAYRSEHSGGATVGDGLNRLSARLFTDHQRNRWDMCHGFFTDGSDCLTPKGFSFARHHLDDGAVVDVYNWHADAGSDSRSKAARRDNVRQLLAAIESISTGHAVLVIGDTNSRYTRTEDAIADFVAAGFKDAWVEGQRGGNYPQPGDAALTQCDNPASARCEIVDKVLYRDGIATQLSLLGYQIPAAFVDAQGERLSDHWPVSARFSYHSDELRYTTTLGGPHGAFFNDAVANAVVNGIAVSRVAIRAGKRLNAIEFTYEDQSVQFHGGNGGSYKAMDLSQGEVIERARICQDKKNTTRIFYIELTSNYGQVLTGGQQSGVCQTFEANSTQGFVGAYGRSGNEVDRLGFIY